MEKTQQKYCKKCSTLKEINNFSINNASFDGLVIYCKDCMNKKRKEFGRTERGLCFLIYADQKHNSKARGHNPPNYTKLELYDWIASSDIFHKLYNDWAHKNFVKNLRPSIDRIDDYEGYSFDNIQLTTWKNNKDKQSKDIFLNRSTSGKAKCKPVYQYSMDGKFIAEYHSAAKAQRDTGIYHISCCCLSERNHAGGFRWAYKKS